MRKVLTNLDTDLSREDIFREGVKHRRAKRYEDAIKSFRNLQELFPESTSVAQGMLGSVFYEIGQLAEAASCFKAVLSLQPRSQLASWGFFHSCLEQGLDIAALDEGRRYLELVGGSSNVSPDKREDFELYREAIRDLEARIRIDG